MTEPPGSEGLSKAMNEPPGFVLAHRHSSRHRQELMASEKCGCFYCLSVFAPSEICAWLDAVQTAQCPRCGTDAVIGSASGYPLTPEFLKQMQRHWFETVSDRNTVRQVVREQPYPLLFVTISGAHLYGFPSPDSDYDLRGVHILPVPEVVGLHPPRETVEVSEVRDGREIDLVTHDVKKFVLLMLKKNGYVLEQLLSPLVVQTTPEHEELKAIAKGCITRHHAHHYLGFAETQWNLFRKEQPPRAKPLLYLYRVLFTGIHLMRTGEIEASLLRLRNEVCGDPTLYRVIDDLIARKLAGPEQSVVPEADLAFHEREYHRLVAELEQASEKSALPEKPSAGPALNDLLVRVRMAGSTA